MKPEIKALAEIQSMSAGDIVDRLGEIKAEIADLTSSAEECKSIIISACVAGTQDAIEGKLFRATVSWQDKTVVDYKAIVARLAAQCAMPATELAKLIKANSKTAESFPVVRVSTRKGK